MRRWFVAIVPSLALIAAKPVTAADLVDTAEHSATSKTFLAAAKAAGMTQTLKNNGPYTIFLPTDSAFKQLPPDTMDSLMKDKKKLAQVLAYHVVPGRITVADVKPGEVKTMEGEPLKLASDNGKVTINDEANVIQSDVMADNGVIHEIDKVILPR